MPAPPRVPSPSAWPLVRREWGLFPSGVAMPQCPKCEKTFGNLIFASHERTCQGKSRMCQDCGAAYTATLGHVCRYVPPTKVYDGNAPLVELLKRNSGS